jgi:hypothetical protein
MRTQPTPEPRWHTVVLADPDNPRIDVYAPGCKLLEFDEREWRWRTLGYCVLGPNPITVAMRQLGRNRICVKTPWGDIETWALESGDTQAHEVRTA